MLNYKQINKYHAWGNIYNYVNQYNTTHNNALTQNEILEFCISLNKYYSGDYTKITYNIIQEIYLMITLHK